MIARRGTRSGSAAIRRADRYRPLLAVPAALITGIAGTLTGCTADGSTAPVPPPRYLGLDSYLHWDALPYLEIGDRVGGMSTADPEGGNADNTHTLGDLPAGGRVLLDQTGPGLLTFLRMQQHTGGPWRLSADGRPPSTIGPADLGGANPAYPYPLSLNPAQSQGSSILATSLPYRDGIRFTSSAANGNFYSLYRRLPVGSDVPQWTATEVRRAAAMLAAAGTDPNPPGGDPRTGSIAPRAGTPTPVLALTGSRQLQAIHFRVPLGEQVRFGNSRLRIYWDGEQTPSVDAPVKFLAGDGAGVYEPAGRDLVRALPSAITGDGPGFLRYSLYWPMPFTSAARIELTSAEDIPEPVRWSVTSRPFTDPPNWVGEFHANYVDIPHPVPGQDMSFLDVRGAGKLVGTVVNFGAVGDTLEGDPHLYLDDSRTPQIAVTGTEEWGMGGDYWNNGHQTTLPLAGLPSSTTNPTGSDVDGAAEYRYLIADSIPFSTHLVVHWEHGAADDSTQRYRATMLWYGTPSPTAVRGDELLPGDPASAAAHGWSAPGARPRPLTSGYEYTVRAAPVSGRVLDSPASSAFTLALRPDNLGGFLRRSFDSCVPGQRATVSVDGAFAGTWADPGAPRPAGSPAPTRCWREEDLPLPQALTQGKRSISIRIDNAAPDPASTPWTAADYQLYAFSLG